MEDIAYDDKELIQLLQKKDRMDLYSDCFIEIEECEGECVLSELVENICVNNPEKISFKVYKRKDASTRNH